MVLSYSHATRIQAEGRASSRLGTLWFLGFSLVFFGRPQFSLDYSRISGSDVLSRCSYDSSLTVENKNTLKRMFSKVFLGSFLFIFGSWTQTSNVFDRTFGFYMKNPPQNQLKSSEICHEGQNLAQQNYICFL